MNNAHHRSLADGLSTGAGHRRRRDVREWRELMQLHRGGGASVAVFCQHHGLSQASFYAWRRRLGGPTGADEPSTSSMPVGSPRRDASAVSTTPPDPKACPASARSSSSSSPAGFVRLGPVARDDGVAMIEVRFDCGATLRCPREHLRDLVHALVEGGRPC